jgi:hypothetical protein
MQQYTTLIFIALLAVAFYFLILRPQRKLEISPGAELTVLKQAISRIATEDDEDSADDHDELDEVAALDEHDELNVQDTPLEQNATPQEPPALQPDRPVVEPTQTTAPEPVVKPESSATRDSKPSTAE